MAHEGNFAGTLVKPYGFQGELVLKGHSEILEKLEKGTPLFIDINKQRVPFFIEDISVDASGEKCIIKLEFIDSDAEARKYCSLDVYSELHLTAPELENNLSFYLNFIVKDRNTSREFTVSDFYDNGENPLLVLSFGKEEVLLPLNAEYILHVDKTAKTIEVDLPEGLI